MVSLCDALIVGLKSWTRFELNCASRNSYRQSGFPGAATLLRVINAEERIGIRLRPRIVNPPAQKLTGLCRTGKSPLPILHGHSLRVMTASPFRVGIKHSFCQ